MDYRISSLQSDVREIRYELTKLSGRILDLELERERKKELWETFVQALLMFFGIVMLVTSIAMH